MPGDFAVVGPGVVTLVPLHCGNLDCREAKRTNGERLQVIAQGEPGHLVRAKCSKCGTYTLGRCG